MKYEILRNNELEWLATDVNNAISEGWEPIGGVTMDNWKGFAQAMIHRGEKSE